MKLRTVFERDLQGAPEVTSLAWNLKQEPLLASGDSLGNLRIWDTAGNELAKERAHSSEGWVNAVAWGRLGESLLVITGGDRNGNLRLYSWSGSKLAFIREVPVFREGWVKRLDVAIFEEGVLGILAGGSSGSFAMVELKESETLVATTKLEASPEGAFEVSSVSIASLSSTACAVVAWRSGQVRVFDWKTSAMRGEWQLSSRITSLTTLSGRDATVAILGMHGNLGIVDVKSNRQPKEQEVASGWLKGLNSVDSRYGPLVMGAFQDEVRAWRPYESHPSDGFNRMREVDVKQKVEGIESFSACSVDGSVWLALGTQRGRLLMFCDDSVGAVEASILPPESRRPKDRYRRMELAAHILDIGAQLVEVEANQDPTALLLVDGNWGSGKSVVGEYITEAVTLMKAGSSRLAGALIVPFNCWREARISPQWWSLPATVYRKVSRELPWPLRLLLWLRLAGPSTLGLIAVMLVFAIGVAVPGASSGGGGAFLNNVGLVAITVAGGSFWALGNMLFRSLFWASPLLGKLHMAGNERATDRIYAVLSILRRWCRRGVPRVAVAILKWISGAALLGTLGLFCADWSLVWIPLSVMLICFGLIWHLHFKSEERPVVLILEDMDRCEADVIVEYLETMQTLFRVQPSQEAPTNALVALVLADGEWLGAAFEATRQEFSNVQSQLGDGFLNRIFDYTILLPAVNLRQNDMLSGLPERAAETSTLGAAEQSGDANDIKGHLVTTGGPDGAESEFAKPNERRLPSVVEHLVERYHGLLPANPRMVRRVAGSFLMLKALRANGVAGRVPPGYSEEEMLLRAAVLLASCPMLVKELLRLDVLPLRCDSGWRYSTDRLRGSAGQVVERLIRTDNPKRFLQLADLLSYFGSGG